MFIPHPILHCFLPLSLLAFIGLRLPQDLQSAASVVPVHHQHTGLKSKWIHLDLKRPSGPVENGKSIVFFEIQCFWNDCFWGKSNVFGRF